MSWNRISTVLFNQYNRVNSGDMQMAQACQAVSKQWNRGSIKAGAWLDALSEAGLESLLQELAKLETIADMEDEIRHRAAFA